jgi:hypothetical protein
LRLRQAWDYHNQVEWKTPSPGFRGRAPAVNSGLTRSPTHFMPFLLPLFALFASSQTTPSQQNPVPPPVNPAATSPGNTPAAQTRQMTRLRTRSISTWFWCAWWFATRNTASISDVLFVGAGDSVKLLCYSGGTAGDVAFNAGITATLINSSDKAKKAHSRRHVTPEQDHSR